VNASFLVIFVQLWNEELLEHVQIHDTGKTFKVVKLFLKHPVQILPWVSDSICINKNTEKRVRVQTA